MPRKSSLKIVSVFSKFLGTKAREIAADGYARIIEQSDFPEGAPIHEDGSSEYDPHKPLVLFAVQITDPEGHRRWAEACREFDRIRKGVA